MFKSEIYPLWLNIVAAIVLIMVPVGFVISIFFSWPGFLIAGLGCLGCLGVGISGNIAHTYKKE